MLTKKFENIISFNDPIFMKLGIPQIQEEENSKSRPVPKKFVVFKDQKSITNYFSKI